MKCRAEADDDADQGNEEFVVCVIIGGVIESCSLDLIFGGYAEFFAAGDYPVDLTGFFMPVDEYDSEDEMPVYEDDSEEHFEEEELRSGKVGPAPADGKDGKPVLVVRGLPERDAICDALAHGFSYLEDRLTGRCDAPYSCVDMYEICRLVQAFDPNFAAAHMTPSVVDAMQIITPLQYHGMLGQLKTELPAYLAEAAQAPAFDRAGDVGDYTEAILTWWRVNGNGFPAWAEAARIVFALAPNSASCERVFARLKKLFGDEQMSALADYIQAALMLAYNGRRVG